VSAEDLHRLLAFAHELADAADAIALRVYSGELAVRIKPDATLVTQADTEIESTLRRRIAAAYPDHGLVGEEYGTESGGARWRWVLDPIDGTHNFVRGIPVFGTLIGLARDSDVVVGVASAPALATRWWAARGEGAHRRDATGVLPIQVSDVARLSDAQVCYPSLRGVERAGLGGALRTTVLGAWRDRGFGDFWAHMLVAQGSAEVMLEVGVKPWDMAAPYAIVTEAGGRMTDHAGADSWTTSNILTTNSAVHDELLAILR
jgi:histidinol-phosphatase